jgi:hypothetical protein
MAGGPSAVLAATQVGVQAVRARARVHVVLRAPVGAEGGQRHPFGSIGTAAPTYVTTWVMGVVRVVMVLVVCVTMVLVHGRVVLWHRAPLAPVIVHAAVGRFGAPALPGLFGHVKLAWRALAFLGRGQRDDEMAPVMMTPMDGLTGRHAMCARTHT